MLFVNYKYQKSKIVAFYNFSFSLEFLYY